MSRREPKREPPLEGRVVGLARGGDAVVETAQGRVYVPLVAPGDRIRLRIVERDRRIVRGEALAVIEAGAARVDSPCAYADRCGGCPFLVVDLETQRRTKLGFLESALPRGGVAPGLEARIVAAGAPLGYRRRARLAFERVRTGVHLGYRPRRSRGVVDVERCVVLSEALAEGLAALRPELLPALEGSGEIRLSVGAEGRAIAVIESEGPQPARVYELAERLVGARFAGLAIRAGGASAPALFGDPVETIPHPSGLGLRGTVGGFSQANDAVNTELVRAVVELARPEGARILELYAGSGNLTVALAPSALSHTAVELDREASEACRRNVAAIGAAVRVVTADAAAAPRGPVDVIVLDPPRTGAEEAIETVLACAPHRVVYVSCDTGTLGRDLARLASAGYVVDAAWAFDMFPGTPHVESLVRLVRRPMLAPVPGER